MISFIVVVVLVVIIIALEWCSVSNWCECMIAIDHRVQERKQAVPLEH